MKQFYEEPTIETIIIDGTIVVAISNGTDPEVSDEYDNMFG